MLYLSVEVFFFFFLFAAVFFKLWVGHGLLRTDRRMQYARYKTDKGIRKGMNDAAKTYKKGKIIQKTGKPNST